jgi:hypothetical protein
VCCGRVTHRRVPWTAVLPRPLQYLQVPARSGEADMLPRPTGTHARAPTSTSPGASPEQVGVRARGAHEVAVPGAFGSSGGAGDGNDGGLHGGRKVSSSVCAPGGCCTVVVGVRCAGGSSLQKIEPAGFVMTPFRWSFAGVPWQPGHGALRSNAVAKIDSFSMYLPLFAIYLPSVALQRVSDVAPRW